MITNRLRLNNKLFQCTFCLLLTTFCLTPSESQSGNYYKKKNDKKNVDTTNRGLSLQFRATGTSSRIVDPIANRARQKWISIGIVAGDSITFTAILTPTRVLPSSDYVWSGVASGIGSSITIAFSTPGTYTQAVTVKGSTRMARITVIRISGVSLNSWRWTHGPTALRAKGHSETAESWAFSTPALWGLLNGPTDAGRHMLWNALMVTDPLIGPADAATIATGHEVDEVDSSPHNECVMDMLNNVDGRAIGAANAGATTATLQTAVIAAVNGGTGTILDVAKPNNGGNTGNVGLLLPSNK